MTAPASNLLARYAESQDPDLAELIVAEAWPIAYRACRKALGDAQRAEDAAQEAMIKLLELADRFEGDRRLGPWVAALASNVARTQQRGDRRRAKREEAVARPDRQVDGSDPLELDEVRAAVDALPKSLREPVRLRYYGGLSFKEVAEALEIPEGTAATRIRKGKRRLKKELEAAGYSTPSVIAGLGWLKAPLDDDVPPAPDAGDLGLRPRPPRAWPPVAWLAASLAVVAAALGLGLWLSAAPPEAPAQVAEGDPGAAPVAGGSVELADGSSPVQPIGDGDPSPAADPDAGDAADRVWLRGRLVGRGELTRPWAVVLPAAADGAVAEAGGELAETPEFADLLRTLRGQIAQGLAAEGHALPVDAEGRFEVELAPGRYMILARAAEHERVEVPLTVGEAGAHVEVPLPFLGRGQLEVTVLDGEGQPLADAALRFTLPRAGEVGYGVDATTDADGVARFDAPGGDYALYASGEAGTSSAAAVQVASESTARASVRFPGSPEVRVSVRVVDREGRPVAGAWVAAVWASPIGLSCAIHDELRFPPRDDYVQSGADGSAEVSWKHPVPILVLARHGDWGGRSEIAFLHGPQSPREIKVVLGERLGVGRLEIEPTLDDEAFEGQDPRTLAGVRLSYQLYTTDGRPLDVSRYSGMPAHVYEDVPAGEVQLVVTAWRADEDSRERTRWWGPTRRIVRVQPAASTRVAVSLAPQDQRLRLHLLDPSGEGRFAAVRVEHPGGRQTLIEEPIRFGLEPGRYDLALVDADQPVDVTVWGNGWAIARFEGLVPSEGLHELHLPSDAPSWTIEVVDAEGNPIEGAEVAINGLSAWMDYSTRSMQQAGHRTDAAGRLVVRGHLPDQVTLQASALGRLTRRDTVSLETDRPTRVVLEKNPGGLFGRGRSESLLQGRVVDVDGRPVPGAAFQAIGPSGYGTGRRSGSQFDGSFLIKRCEAGRVVLRAYRADLGLSPPLELDVVKGEPVTGIELVMTRGVRLRGHVRRQGATGEERVALLDMDGLDWSRLGRKHSYGVQVGANGWFDLGPIPPGSWQLVVRDRKRGAEIHRQTITLKPGAAPFELQVGR